MWCNHTWTLWYVIYNNVNFVHFMLLVYYLVLSMWCLASKYKTNQTWVWSERVHESWICILMCILNHTIYLAYSIVWNHRWEKMNRQILSLMSLKSFPTQHANHGIQWRSFVSDRTQYLHGKGHYQNSYNKTIMQVPPISEFVLVRSYMIIFPWVHAFLIYQQIPWSWWAKMRFTSYLMINKTCEYNVYWIIEVMFTNNKRWPNKMVLIML